MEQNSDSSHGLAPHVAPFPIAINNVCRSHFPGRLASLCELVTQYGCNLFVVAASKTKDPLKNATKSDKMKVKTRIENEMLKNSPSDDNRLRCCLFRRKTRRLYVYCIPPYILCVILQAALAVWIIVMMATACYEDGSGYVTFKNASVAVPREDSDVKQWIGGVTDDFLERIYDWNTILTNDTRDTVLRKLCFSVHCGCNYNGDLEYCNYSCRRPKVIGWHRYTGNRSHTVVILGLMSSLMQICGILGTIILKTTRRHTWYSEWRGFCNAMCVNVWVGGFINSLAWFFCVIVIAARVVPIFYGILS
ncbi:uncharacterized protein LOC129594589 isoform X2 [Paramacrobiotus metropolitanus]|uniref:uncharacterized protein LOC129594589 isoform X2 n=1 Tax=Paramacrobiotus metropolitanus TaxID=2943436 RepID=UPI002445C5B8|nr:uncharacterized protein LOC129594589 isoform X2 [Paramacrobiotus metropolitanus]